MTEPEHGESIEQDVYLALTKTFLLLDDFDRRFFAQFELSARQYWTLTHLDEKRGRPMVELGQLLLTDKSNVTGIVDRLEKSGLAQRTTAPKDRRVMLIKLTPKGRQLRELIETQHQARVRELMGNIDAARLRELRAQLETIERNMEDYLQRAERAALA